MAGPRGEHRRALEPSLVARSGQQTAAAAASEAAAASAAAPGGPNQRVSNVLVMSTQAWYGRPARSAAAHRRDASLLPWNSSDR
mmetsp:Transcript_14230/g.41494  ORF Transcript_14230/g.41494 Transcript_14230/m.41494 type:complete len:84 (+) Transcript_14230:677-928(+)